MEIVQEIGSYAGFAAVVGLAILSALYFSQARDVKRLREWAGRAPDRAPTPQVPAAGEPRSVVAQPIAKPVSRPIPGGTPPPVPRPPGAQPATPAAAAAAGAAPAIARGPEVGDEGEQDEVAGEVDVTRLDTEIHPPPEPLPGDGEDQPDGAQPAEGEIDEGPADVAADGAEESTGDYAPVDPDATAVYEAGDTGERDAVDADGFDETGEGDALADDGDPQETGEWRPEDEHSDIDFTDEHDAVGPATPVGAAAPQPPTPPRPYQRRGTAGAATGYARDRGGSILPPYEESRPGAEDDDEPGGGKRRPWLLIAAAALAIVVIAFGVMQLTGGDDSGGGSDDAGLSTGGSSDGGGGSSSGGGDAPPIDPADVTVAVLNGTTVPGLAATIGDKVVGEGFRLGTVTNSFDQEKAESVVLYSPGAEREAAAVARSLDISQREAIDAESQALAGDATVVVVAGADQNQ